MGTAGWDRFGPERAYDATLGALGAVAVGVTAKLQSGLLRRYVAITLLSTIVLLLSTLLLRGDAVVWPQFSATISVPIGEDNMFLTGEPDRGQPTTFLPGHHRFQCMMVVDGDFDGVLRWRLSLGDETHLTSDSMLQYSWEFDANSERQARRDVDPTTAPRNVCLNRSPIVRVLGPTELTGTVGEGVKLFGSVRDEGLPRDVPVTAAWQQTSGPGTATFDVPDTPRTLAFFDRPGSYTVELRGSDGVFERTASVTVDIQPAR